MPRSVDLGAIGIAQCLCLSHFLLDFDHTPSLDPGRVAHVFGSLRGMPKLRKVTLAIRLSDWSQAEETVTEVFMTPIEDVLLGLDSVKRVQVRLPSSHNRRNQYSGSSLYREYLRSFTSSRFPRLYEKGVAVAWQE